MIEKGSIFDSTKIDQPKIEILPHPKAPLFAGADRDRVVEQVMQDMTSGHFSEGNREIREAFRQASLVSLWFFLKFVAGYSGPYEQVNTKLHVDMCNFYQRVRRRGGKAAGFLPRGTFKSTIFTHGANSWEILRDPDIIIGLCSGIMDRAEEFLKITQRTFDSNAMLAWLFPEFVMELDTKGVVTADTFVVPNRTKYNVHPTIKIFAVGGSTQGIHVTYLKVDDPIGDAQLDAERNPNADMRRIEHWLKSNVRTLLIEPEGGQVFLVGTRYSAGDAYTFVFENIRSIWGYPDPEEVKLSEDGEWDVYFREVREDGQLLFPERVSERFLKKLEEEDPWTLWTQYYNKTTRVDSTEFSGYRLKECWLDQGGFGEWIVRWMEDGEWKQEPLSDMYVVQAVDPAATERRTDARTSRSACVVYARASGEERFILRVDAGYVRVSEIFNWVFRNRKTYPEIQVTVLEAQGPFKMLYPLILEEQRRRGEYLSVVAKKTGTQDKDARIRVALDPILKRGMVWATRQALGLVEEEMRVFPSGSRKDILDAWALAEASTHPVESREEAEEEEWEQQVVQTSRNPVTGY